MLSDVDESRTKALLLSLLVLTPDAKLAELRRRPPTHPAIEVDDLRHAREVLVALATAVETAEPQRLRWLRAAWALLEGEAQIEREAPVEREAPIEHVLPSVPPARAVPLPLPPVSDHWFESNAPAPAPAFEHPPAALRGTHAFAARPDPSLSTLPFHGEAAPPSATAAQAVPHEAIGETSMVPALDLDAEVLPFSPRSMDPHLKAFTVENYAALCVERAAQPSDTTRIALRYHLTEDQLERLDAHWRQRLAADATTLGQFTAHYDRFMQWLTQPPEPRG